VHCFGVCFLGLPSDFGWTESEIYAAVINISDSAIRLKVHRKQIQGTSSTQKTYFWFSGINFHFNIGIERSLYHWDDLDKGHNFSVLHFF
jgi:hypothetical protein